MHLIASGGRWLLPFSRKYMDHWKKQTVRIRLRKGEKARLGVSWFNIYSSSLYIHSFIHTISIRPFYCTIYRYHYFIFLDYDIRLCVRQHCTKGGGPHPWRLFESYLLESEPAIGLPFYNMGAGLPNDVSISISICISISISISISICISISISISISIYIYLYL